MKTNWNAISVLFVSLFFWLPVNRFPLVIISSLLSLKLHALDVKMYLSKLFYFLSLYTHSQYLVLEHKIDETKTNANIIGSSRTQVKRNGFICKP